MGDLIDRQEAIETVRKCAVKEVTPAYMLIDKAEVMTDLMLLPSAQPERKTGRWIHKGCGGFACDKCGEMVTLNVYTSEKAGDRFKFCPNCGSPMEKEGEG